MIIRATGKQLKVCGIKPVGNEWKSNQIFPGEWYGNALKIGHEGIHWLPIRVKFLATQRM